MAPILTGYHESNHSQDLEESIKIFKEWTNVLTVLVVILCICTFITFCLQLFKLITTTISVISPEELKRELKKRKSSKGKSRTRRSKSKSDSSSVKKVKGKSKVSKSAPASSNGKVKSTSTEKTIEKKDVVRPATPAAQTSESVKVSPQHLLTGVIVPAVDSMPTTDISKSEKANTTPNQPHVPAISAESAQTNAKLQTLNDKKLMNPIVGSVV